MTQEYVQQLANGLYMGSDGSFLENAPIGVPVIESTKFEFPVDPAKVKDALKSIKEGIEDATNDLDTLEFLASLGIEGQLLDALKDFGKIAGTLAKFVPYVQAAYALLDFFGLLGKKGEISPALQQRFDQIEEILKAQDRKWTDVTATKATVTVTSFLDAVSVYEGKLAKYGDIPPSVTEWLALDSERQLKLAAADGTTPDSGLIALKTMCDPAIWHSLIVGLDPDDPAGSWDAFRPMNLMVEDAFGTWRPAPPAHVGTISRFDHRAMAHYVPALVHSYLASIKMLLPEYRSVGRFRSHLQDVANLIESLLWQMRTNLGRTHFINVDFPNPLWRPGEWWGAGFPPAPRVDVGAYDIVGKARLPKYMTDWPTSGIWDSSDNIVDLGSMTYNWPAPTDYRHDGTRDGQGWYKWDLHNQAACVSALNAESAIRYGALLYSSGYLQLAQTAALLRHLCCAPERSETVMAGFRSTTNPGTVASVQVVGKSVIPFEPVVGQADRLPRSISVTARLLLQSPFTSVTDPINYRVYLRTMPARRIDSSSDYSSFYWTTRKRIPAGDAEEGQPPKPAIDALVCQYTGGHLDQELLVQGRTQRTVAKGASPADTPLKLNADTFDVWVPVPDITSMGLVSDVFTGIEKTKVVVTAAGNKPSSRFASTIDGLVREYASAPERPDAGEGAGGKAPQQRDLGDEQLPDPRGERRNLIRSEVLLHYEWTWNGPLLEIQIQADAANPNVDLYLVVEEEIVDQQWRHSSFRIPLVTQLTYVPQAFLEAEAEKAKRANSFWRGLVSKYVETASLSPEDPIARFGRVSLADVEERMALQAAMQNRDPEFLARYTRDYEARNAARSD
jgi:hypothetical protein